VALFHREHLTDDQLSACLDAAPAAAQAAAQRGQSALEVGLNAVFFGPTTAGRADADLIRPDGRPTALFRTENRFDAGLSAEATLSASVSRRLALEVAGTLGRTRLRTGVTDDVEGAAEVAITAPVVTVSVEGHAVWAMRTGVRSVLFLRGGGGWLRELVDGGVLSADGAVGNIGVGMKYWWRARPPRQLGRVGLRIEGRALMRSSGVSFGPRGIRIAPAASVGLVMRFF